MKLSGKKIGHWGIFEVQGMVDSVHTKIFTDTLSEYLRTGPANLVIDLSKTPFLSIGAIRHLNQTSQTLLEKGGRLVVMGVNDRIRKHVDIFVSWSKLKEISSLWEVVPLQMAAKINEAPDQVLFEPANLMAPDIQD